MKKVVIQRANGKLSSRIKKGWALREAFSEKTIEIRDQKSFFSKYLYAFNFNVILNNSAFSEVCFYGLSQHQFINLICFTKQDPTSINLQALVLNFDELFGKSFTYKGYLNYLPRFIYDEPSKILFTLSKLESRISKIQFIKSHPFVKPVCLSPGRLSKQYPSPYDYLYFFYIHDGLFTIPLAEETAIERILFQEINHMISNFNNLQINYDLNQYLYSPQHNFDLIYEHQRKILKSLEISEDRYIASIEDIRICISKKGLLSIIEISNLYFLPVEVQISHHKIKKIITYNEAKVINESIVLEGFGYILIELEYLSTKGVNFYEVG